MANSEDRMTFMVSSADPEARSLDGGNIRLGFLSPIRPKRIDNWQTYEVALHWIEFDTNETDPAGILDVECNLMLLSSVADGERKVILRMPTIQYLKGKGAGTTASYVEPHNLMWFPLDSFTEIRQVEVRITNVLGDPPFLAPVASTVAAFVVRRKSGE